MRIDKTISTDFIKKIRETVLKAIQASTKIMLNFRKRLDELKINQKPDGSFATEADYEVQQRIIKILSDKFPKHRFFGEEKLSKDVLELNAKNHDSRFVWIIDPIDGTRKFIDKDSDYYGVAVALLHDGYPIFATFFAPEYKIDGGQGALFEASYDKEGAYLNGKKVSVSPSLDFGHEKAFISRTISKIVLNWQHIFANPFQHVQERTGSGTLCLCRVACSSTYSEPIFYAFGEAGIWNSVVGGYMVIKAGGAFTDVLGNDIFPITQPVNWKKLKFTSLMAGSREAVDHFTKIIWAVQCPPVKVIGYRAENITGIDPNQPELTMGDLVSASALSKYAREYDANHFAQEVFIRYKDVKENKITTFSVLKALETGNAKAKAAATLVIQQMGMNLGRVIKKLLRWEYWQNTQRIFVGGGLSAGRIGDILIEAANAYLLKNRIDVDIKKIHYPPDYAGLIGAMYLVPYGFLQDGDGVITVDIGGTKIRVGIGLKIGREKRKSAIFKDVIKSKSVKTHRNKKMDRESFVNLLIQMIVRNIEKARELRIPLSKYIGIGCPGLINDRGYIVRGARKLPGNWADRNFHLPSIIENQLTKRGYQGFKICIKNDAVTQGLCELPFTQDVAEWGILTIGTGLGNAKFMNKVQC